MRAALLALLPLLIPLRPLLAQRVAARFVRIEAGRAEIHRAGSTGRAAALRFGRGLGSGGRIRTDIGAAASSADEGYLVVELGLEVVPLPALPIAPFAGVGAGFLIEPEFSGAAIRLTFGIEAALNRGMAARVAYQAGSHGGERGPNVWLLGLEFRGATR